MIADKKLLFARFRNKITIEADNIIKRYGENAGLSDAEDLTRMAIDYRAAYERSPGTKKGFDAWRNSRIYLEASEQMAYLYLRRSAEEVDKRLDEQIRKNPKYVDELKELNKTQIDLADEVEKFLENTKFKTDRELRILLGIERENAQ